MSYPPKEIKESFILKLNTNFPNINPSEGEDLNIENNIVKILRKCWGDIEKYKRVTHIAHVMNVSEREIFRLAKKHDFPSRRELVTDFNKQKKHNRYV